MREDLSFRRKTREGGCFETGETEWPHGSSSLKVSIASLSPLEGQSQRYRSQILTSYPVVLIF